MTCVTCPHFYGYTHRAKYELFSRHIRTSAFDTEILDLFFTLAALLFHHCLLYDVNMGAIVDFNFMVKIEIKMGLLKYRNKIIKNESRISL